MIKSLVVNSSPIICLAKADLAHLLLKACDSLFVPEGVIDEIKQGSKSDPGKLWIIQYGENLRASVPEIENDIQKWLLGRGESEVLQWAKLTSSTALVDDYQARKCAESLKVSVLGTLGFILKCKSMGLIPEVKSAVHSLLDSGLYVDQSVVKKILEFAQEL